MNYTDGDYKFTVCTETDQLTSIGNQMHICVGSYGNRAVNKDCLIVEGRFDNRLFTCIEIRNKRLVQVKGYCNRLLEGDERETVIKWAKEKSLKYENCFDISDGLRRPEDEEPEIDPIPIEELIENGEFEIPDEDEEPVGDIWLPF